MKSGSKKVLLALGVFCVFPACGNNSERLPVQRERQGILSKSKVESVLELKNATWKEECDGSRDSIKLEIAQVLDAKQAELDAYRKLLPESPGYSRIRLGRAPHEFILREPSEVKKDLSHEWKESEESWEELYEHFLEIKNEPISARWDYLEVYFNSIAGSDRDRTVEGEDYSLGKDSGPKIEKLFQELKKTKSFLDCVDRNFSPESLSFINSIDLYKGFWKRINDPNRTPEERQNSYTYFLKWISYGRDGYTFTPNLSIKKISKDEIELPIFSNASSDILEKIEKYSAEIWTFPDLKLKIRWVNDLTGSPENSIFSLFIDRIFGRRSYVSTNKREMHLFQDVRATTIPHEIGHVLGFPDRYYEIWNAQKCSYTTQYLEIDVMSSSPTGHATLQERLELKEAYLK
ncbi:hypothetical protein K2X30_14125 [bacterium]|nr:hypothetical protein [bacterium]